MSKLTDSLRTVGVFNPDTFADGQPFIDYVSIRGRGHNFQGWRVYKAGLNLGQHWTDANARSFSTYHHPGPHKNAKAAALAEAQAWASERFGVKEWARDPYGAYGPAEYVAGRLAELKQALAPKNSRPEGRPFVAAGGEAVSPVPHRRNLLLLGSPVAHTRRPVDPVGESSGERVGGSIHAEVAQSLDAVASVVAGQAVVQKGRHDGCFGAGFHLEPPCSRTGDTTESTPGGGGCQ